MCMLLSNLFSILKPSRYKDWYGSQYYQIKSVEFVKFLSLSYGILFDERTSSMLTTTKIMIDICKVVVEVNKH